MSLLNKVSSPRGVEVQTGVTQALLVKTLQTGSLNVKIPDRFALGNEDFLLQETAHVYTIDTMFEKFSTFLD